MRMHRKPRLHRLHSAAFSPARDGADRRCSWV
jgi:hypothetical protein